MAVLRQIANAHVCRGHASYGEAHTARVGFLESEHHLYERSFAATVRAYYAEEVVVGHIKAHVLKDGAPIVRSRYVCKSKHNG